MVDVYAQQALLASEIHVSRFQFFSGHISAAAKTQVNIWDTEYRESENVSWQLAEMAVSRKRLEWLRNG